MIRKSLILAGLIIVCLSFTLVLIVTDQPKNRNVNFYTHAWSPNDTRTGDWFGDAVDISDTSMVMAAYKSDNYADEAGAAYIARRDSIGLNTWTRIIGKASKAHDRFGFSVSTSNQFSAVGSAEAVVMGIPKAGAVDLFSSADSWSDSYRLTAPVPSRGDSFGFSVSLQNDILAVGAQLSDIPLKNSGAVYIFGYKESEWHLLQAILPESPAHGLRFGKKVVLSEDWLFIAAPNANLHKKNVGSVFTYKYINNTWVLRQVLKAPLILPENALFGSGIDVKDRTAVIGASTWTAENWTGAAFAYELNDKDVWQLQSRLDPGGLIEGDMFGFRVAIDGGHIFVGAHLDDEQARDAGAIYVFGPQPDWELQKKIVPPDAQSDDQFGIALAADMGRVVIGAERANPRGTDSGGVYLLDFVVNPSFEYEFLLPQ